jgi:Stress responsive A/B Barrel Domain
MIRNVLVARLRPEATPEDAERGLAAMRSLQIDGLLDMRSGLDAGLREGNWDLSITTDFTDAEAYRRYDTDAEHNRIRREIFAPMCTEMARIQFKV